MTIGKAALNRTRNLIFQANVGMSNNEYQMTPHRAADGSLLNKQSLEQLKNYQSTISKDRGRNRS